MGYTKAKRERLAVVYVRPTSAKHAEIKKVSEKQSKSMGAILLKAFTFYLGFLEGKK